MYVYMSGNPAYFVNTFSHSFTKRDIRKLVCVIPYIVYSRRGKNYKREFRISSYLDNTQNVSKYLP